MSKNMLSDNQYEMMLILSPDILDKDQALAEVKEEMVALTGAVTHEDLYGLRDLAYTIKKQDKGFYVVYIFTMGDKTKLKELDRLLTINPNVLRFNIIKTPKNYEYVSLGDYLAAAEKEEELKKQERAAKRPGPMTPKPAAKRAPAAKVAKKDDKLKDIINDPDISV